MADLAIFNRMIEDLEDRGLSESDIEKVGKYWETAQNNKPLPCPTCILRGETGALVPLAEDAKGVESVRCTVCDDLYELSEP
jgi:hypothetical protein